MTDAREYIVDHWFSLLLLLVGGGLAVFALLRRPRPGWVSAPMLIASTLGLIGLGGSALPLEWGLWFGAAVLLLLFGKLLVVITSGSWSAAIGYVAGAIFCVCLGSVANASVGGWLTEAGRVLISLQPTQPWWLLLLALIPYVIFISYRSLAGLGPVRRWIAIGLRSLLVLLLTLALAEVRLRHDNENLTVLFLVDRSLSIPEEYDTVVSPEAARSDLRRERIEHFVNDMVKHRGAEHKFDRAGLVMFGRRPRLELPASTAPQFNFRFKDAVGTIDGNYTDIAAALKLALASFPEGTGKRVVLISDGNENLGNAEEQARLARLNGVQIDVVPLAVGYRNENEVLVQAVEAPPRTEQGSRLPIRVLVRSYNPRVVYGTLTLKQVSEGESTNVAPSPAKVRLHPGLNPFSFKQPLTSQQRSYTYQAVFQPEAVQDDRGQLAVGLEGDRIQNNAATTHVVALGQKRILLIEQSLGEHQLLLDRLRAMANAKYKVYNITPGKLPQGKAELGVFLSEYDCVILANVPAESLSVDQQEMIRSNTHDQGCGLIMIGGADSFGAGGWQQTPVEKALPVDCEIKSFKVNAKGGLVLIMHACEMMDGNRWEKDIAKLAIDKLSPNDEVGIVHYEFGGHKWHIPLQEIRNKKKSLKAQVDRMVPGDMPDFDGPLKMAIDSLNETKRQLATKHVIIITDGDPQLQDRSLLSRMKRTGITLTTVGVATHGVNEDQKLKEMAAGAARGGKFHKVMNPRALPSIYIKEVRLVSQSFIHAARFQPRLVYRGGPTDKLPEALNPLYGFVRTTPKQSPLLEMPILGPPSPDQDFPILAYWPYGLGKSVAFTSDARSLPGQRVAWDRDWAGSDMYSKFWEQVVEWSLRATESGRMMMTTEYSDGKVKVIVDARDDRDRPVNDLILRGGITTPSEKPGDTRPRELRFVQKNSGLYEAEFKADESGSYFIDAQAVRRKAIKNRQGQDAEVEEGIDSVRAGVTIPYSPEFTDLESNTALLERIRDMTGGNSISEARLVQAVDPRDPAAASVRADLVKEIYRSGLPHFRNLQPVWYWLVFAAGCLMFFDVGVRRIALQPAEVAATAQTVWTKLRRRAAMAETTPQFIDRLKSRKAQVGESLAKERAIRRFEGAEAIVVAPQGADESPLAQEPVRPAASQRIAPEGQQEATDYASRLLKAKKRVWEESDKR